ncbi:MAG: hypothetical protein KF841_13405 [Phycisphaerae bacterium]|nr:hypothetical protein [Phycisphaerae bacterium]
MIYAAACIWLLIAVFMAWGIDRLWATMVTQRTLDILLFPGTAIAYIGRIVALLVTGARLNPKAVAPPDKKEPRAFDGFPYEPNVPFFGPLMVAFVPLAFTLLAIYVVLTRFGQPVLESVAGVDTKTVAFELPVSLSVFWDQLRGMITLAERTLDGLRHSNAVDWQVFLLTYLLISLSVRLSPFKGNAAGHLGAIVILSAASALIGTLTSRPAEIIAGGWPLFCVTIGTLVLLLLGTLAARGVFETIRLLSHRA